MEDILLCSFVSVQFLIVIFWFLTRNRHKNIPPSPLALPFLGHLHLIEQPLHRSLWKLSQKYGPIISLKFGSRLVVVVSSSAAVEECFTKNDVVLANRPKLIVGRHLGYNYSSMVTAAYGDHWRNLRRISALEIFSPNRLNIFLDTRGDEIKILLNKLHRASFVGHGQFVKAELTSMFTELTYNIIVRMVAGKRYYGEGNAVHDEEATKFREIIGETLKYAAPGNPIDFFPILKWLDYQGYIKRVKRLGRETDMILQGLVDEQRSDDLEGRNNLIKHLLSLQSSQPEYYTDEIIKGLIMNLVLAGTDTTSVTLQWAMSNLLNHPGVLEKAKEEMDSQVGQDRLMHESDLSKLPYLQNIISETFRLYPAAPLLLPHVPSSNCTVGGYNVPADTLVLINAWAIHRDPELWDDPTSFRPERFGAGEIEPHKLLPFGSGRRACPGRGLAQRVFGWTLGSLIQCFEWKRVSGEKIDMTEGEGITMPRAQPLEVRFKARHFTGEILN